jgi:hypothetical protein
LFHYSPPLLSALSPLSLSLSISLSHPSKLNRIIIYFIFYISSAQINNN